MSSEKEFHKRLKIIENYKLKFGEGLLVGMVSPVWTEKELDFIFDEGEKAIQGKRGPLEMNEIRKDCNYDYDSKDPIMY